MKYFKQIGNLAICAMLLLSPEFFQAQETSVMIRVQAKDAKFIGSSMGGAKVIVRDERTGEILAEGFTQGGTGNTDAIMKKPITRGSQLSDENTAGFLAKLNIEKPVFVNVEAFAPGENRGKSTAQLWVIPGKDLTGDGLIIEMSGFIIDILSPQTHESIVENKEIEIKANIVMMCGCPITNGGIWDADQYEVKAVISKDGNSVKTLDMKVLDQASTFSGKVKLLPGIYEILVYAFDPVSGNIGVDKTNIIVK
jgi:hypothetical protein